MTDTVQAPIVAVTVYPGQARITRRTTVELEAGARRVELGGLPLGLLRDSVRVNGRGAASVVGVEVTTARHAQSPDAVVHELEKRAAQARLGLAEVTDAETVADGRIELLTEIGRKSGQTLAKALSHSKIEPQRIASVNDALARQLSDALAGKRELADQRRACEQELHVVERELAAVRRQSVPDRQVVVVDLEVRAAGPLEVEVSYVIDDARWSSSYDIRLRGEQLTLTWHAEITQDTGEDWPECELALSTARPAISAQLPELSPWYLDRRPPPLPPVPVAAGGYGGAMEQSDAMMAAAPAAAPMMMRRSKAPAFAPPPQAAVEHGVAATTYRPARTVAVPADGSAHRTTVTVIDLGAALDHVTAPVASTEAFLRATATNTSEHALRPGKASVFHEDEFVGTTSLEVWAPGEEVELNLGVDDRIRVERELVRRTAGKAMIGSSKRREAQYRIKVANHSPRATKVTVLDQIPVSRDDGIAVKDIVCRPDPKERTELGELTWELALEPNAAAEITVGFRVDTAKGVELAGWRE
ncbi:DUF4139 domain-containing protein [Nocardia yamanashiensis]|uniref:DUF4139 domain-containing protein n=1 Tax=Nocardia yamanashiensis TaxID=209247 RepID=UPI00082F3A92|nr:DUF4139 domain-containing protein [Nocardia yamanashiensis]